jgi:hypothetical protein
MFSSNYMVLNPEYCILHSQLPSEFQIEDRNKIYCCLSLSYTYCKDVCLINMWMCMKVIQKVSTVIFSPTIAFGMEGCRCITPQCSIPASQYTLAIGPQAFWFHRRNKLFGLRVRSQSCTVSFMSSTENERPLRAAFRGSNRWKCEGAESGLCAGWSWTLNFSFWRVSSVWAAVWSQVLSCKTRTPFDNLPRGFVRI